MGIRIITDSPSDISRKEGANLKIDIVPLKINIDENSYTEGVDLSVVPINVQILQKIYQTILGFL